MTDIGFLIRVGECGQARDHDLEPIHDLDAAGIVGFLRRIGGDSA